MTNSSQVSRLRASVDAWNVWRSAPPNRTETPDLSGANLVGATLRKAQLAGVNLRGADLSEAELAGADLRNADLRQARLTGANLVDADLSGANLSESDLCGADLRRANVRNANLRLCDLTAARLSITDLRGASLGGAVLKESTLTGSHFGDAALFGCNLNGADLDGCDFSGADLNEADFSGAVAVGCSFGANDLSKSHGLDRVVHVGPSSVATSTLRLTADGLGGDTARRAQVLTFLRGCGVEDDWLDRFGSLIGRPQEFHPCFIAHDPADRAFAQSLHDALQARGIRCWLAPRGVIHTQTRRGVPASARILLCCSAAALRSSWVGKDLDDALENERSLAKRHRVEVRLLHPVVLDAALQSWGDIRAAATRDRASADFTGCDAAVHRFDEQLERVVGVLRTGPESRKR